MRVGIVGAGLQTKRRAPVIKAWPGAELALISSSSLASAKAVADPFGCEAAEGWDWVARRDDIDAVLVCTPPDVHAAICLAALKSGKHVLCEKPMTRTLEEAQELVSAVRASGKCFKVGFNHRYHPGILKAKQWAEAGRLGELLFVRARYGICGRPGYEDEWRGNPQVVAGGQLMEQGIHLIDLSRMFLGEFRDVTGFMDTQYWKTGPLEDNGFVLLRTGRGQVASLHASLTNWKNIFSFEVFGKDGYAVVDGLGGSYGTERASFGRREFDAPFSEETVEFRGADASWKEEWEDFMQAIAQQREPSGTVADGAEAIRLVLAAYDAARQGTTLNLETWGTIVPDRV